MAQIQAISRIIKCSITIRVSSPNRFNPVNHPYRIEFLRYEPDSPVTPPVRNHCHIAYTVSDLDLALVGKRTLLGPFDALDGLRVVFIEEHGAVIEYMHFGQGRSEIS